MNWIALLISLHAIYISVIEFNVRKDSYVNVTIKIFSDDLSDALREDGSIIPRDGEYELSHLESIQSYLKNEFFIHNNNDTTFFDLVSYSSEDQTVWLNMISKNPMVNNANLTASFLLDLFPDQVNMIHLKAENYKQFFQIKRGRETVDLKLE